MDISSDMTKFKQIVLDLSQASSTFIDVWQISIKVDEVTTILLQNLGEIIQIAKGKDDSIVKVSLLDKEKNKKAFVLKSSFINYFSIGYDARVGFGTI